MIIDNFVSFCRRKGVVFMVKKMVAVPIFVLAVTSAHAGYQQVSLEDLITNPDGYDQKVVSFQAEAIGEPLYTESGNWFNVSLDSYNLGVFLKSVNFIEKIKYWGSYKERGDIVEIKGTFYKNCPRHNQMGVHLISLEIAERGKEVEHPVSPEKKRFAFLSLIICLTMGLIYFIRVRLWKKKLKS